MTQEQLAMLLGVSRQSVTKWESERSYPEMDKLIKICQIFECSLDDLVQGDLTGRTPTRSTTSMAAPSGPPQDICGYDEHQRRLAWKVSGGIAVLLVFIGFGLLLEGRWAPPAGGDSDALTVIFILLGVLASLAFFIPAGMEHSAFIKAHPYIEDFYTEDDRLKTRSTFSKAVVAGIGFILLGCIAMVLFGETPYEREALFVLLICMAAGAWLIVRHAMLLGRINIDEYNKNAVDDLEIEDIMKAQIDQKVKDSLLGRKTKATKTSAVCGSIMIISTIIALAMLFVPLGNPEAWSSGEFEPMGTTAAWFWLAWIVGGLLCGIAALLMNAFGKDE